MNQQEREEEGYEALSNKTNQPTNKKFLAYILLSVITLFIRVFIQGVN